MYAVAKEPNCPPCSWPAPHDRAYYNKKMEDIVTAGNDLWATNLPKTVAKLPGASAALFSSYDLVCASPGRVRLVADTLQFWDMYHNPDRFLNGTKPYNVTAFYWHHGDRDPRGPGTLWDDRIPVFTADRAT